MEETYAKTITLDSKDLPEIKKWQVGETYDVIITLKQTGLHQMQGDEVMGTFEIQNVISANNDPMDLEDINNLQDNQDFLRESSKYRAKNS